MAIKRLISLTHSEATKIRERQKVGTMTEFYDDEHYLCYSEEEYKNYKGMKRGRKSKNAK
jgi:hypothetical protein